MYFQLEMEWYSIYHYCDYKNMLKNYDVIIESITMEILIVLIVLFVLR